MTPKTTLSMIRPWPRDVGASKADPQGLTANAALAGTPWSQTMPLLYRSEAFAEDLADLAPTATAATGAARWAPTRPLRDAKVLDAGLRVLRLSQALLGMQRA